MLDGRCREAQLVRRVRAELTEHVGSNPTATQRALIERAAILTLYCAQFDARALSEGGLSDHAAREYLAYSNSLSRTLTKLDGMRGAADRGLSLAAMMDEARREREAAV